MNKTDSSFKRDTSKINLNIEGLRGICAITVVFAHVFGNNILGFKSNSFLSYINFAHNAVLVFFILSGYVIGLNYNPPDFSKKQYLFKRWLRIYPIYFITLLFVFAIEPSLSLSKVIGNLLLISGPLPKVSTNGPLWSIHYEVFFYLFFLIINKTQKGIIFQMAFFTLLAVLIYINTHWPQIIGGYFAGVVFWLSGFLLSKLPTEVTHSKIRIVCLLLLLMAVNHISPGTIFLNRLGFKNEFKDIISFADLFSLPICILLILEGCNIKLVSWIKPTLYIISFSFPILILLYLAYAGRITENERWIVCLVALFFSFIFYFIRQDSNILKKFAFWGSISYALYIIHYPIGLFLGRIYTANTLFEKVLLFTIWACIVTLLASLLEIKLQKKIKDKFNNSKVVSYYPSNATRVTNN